MGKYWSERNFVWPPIWDLKYMLIPKSFFSSPVVSIFMWLVRIILTWEKCLNISIDWGYFFYFLRSGTVKHCFDSFAIFVYHSCHSVHSSWASSMTYTLHLCAHYSCHLFIWNLHCWRPDLIVSPLINLLCKDFFFLVPIACFLTLFICSHTPRFVL